ncbi:type II toxin-antitoxin system RelE/ParE family toxin [bacterium]|nr:type II toxin-antitoxin system RelE/ParE family toxin [bacterium]
MEIREYLDTDGHSVYADWFNELDARAAAKVSTYVTRMSNGNMSQVKGVGAGVYECKIDFGPGYRVYFGKDGDRLIILLGGGTKKRQNNDIQEAQALWNEYKHRKRKGA